MTQKIDRRKFLGDSIALAAATSLLEGLSSSAFADQVAPYCIDEENLVNLKGENLSFGSCVYPYRKKVNDPIWLLNECKSMGLTEIRYALPREHVEHGPNNGAFDPRMFHEPDPEITDMLRNSGFDIILTLNGHPADQKGVPLDWPRNSDGTINGAAAATSFANYTRWVVNHTKEYVRTYELWNEAFGKIEDQEAHKSFGPGGSKQNADNYASMMLPAMAEIRRHDQPAYVAIEGNYWNTERSVGESTKFQHLLAQTDYVVRHPYGYQPAMYQMKGADTKPGFICETTEFYRKFKPNVKWWYTEYNVSDKDVGLVSNEMTGFVQAKAVLRATLLHLRHGIEHLDIFALYYPSLPHFSLCNKDRSRRPAWHAMHSLILSCAPKKQSNSGILKRTTNLPASMRDLAVATAHGFTYMVWQETEAAQFSRSIPARDVAIGLERTDGKELKIANVIDPIMGRKFIVHPGPRTNHVTVRLPVVDYPYLVELQGAG